MLTKGRILLALDEGKPSPDDVIVAGRSRRAWKPAKPLWAFNGAGYLTMRRPDSICRWLPRRFHEELCAAFITALARTKARPSKTQYLSHEDER